jgi:acyl-CoA synthetase (AMP-forming)/AMP-acid ligase II
VSPGDNGSIRLPSQVGDALEVPIARDADHEAVVGSDRRMTYGQLDVATDHAASTLFGLGVRRGDMVGISLPNSTELVVLFYATLRLGAIFLGLNANLAPPEKTYILDDAGAHFLITDHTSAEALDSIIDIPVFPTSIVSPGPWLADDTVSPSPYPRPICHFDEAAGVAYTSGTTGRPKGVAHSHRNLLLPGASLVAARGYGPDLRRGDCASLTILNLQVTSTLLTAQAGGTQIVMDRVDPVGIATWIREERVNSWFGVPTMLHGLATSPDVAPEDLATLRDVWTGGTHAPPSVRGGFEQRFDRPVHATYGMTEVPTVVSIEPLGDPSVPGSSGQVLPQLIVDIRDDEGVVLPANCVGEITVRGQDLGPWSDLYRPMLGYHGQPAETARAVQDGVLYTGDIGELDDGGNLIVRDRRHALILRGGANVYPAEVERVLSELSGVSGAAVIGTPDDRLGQRVAAVVELDPGSDLTVDDLQAHCLKNLARYKVPDQWRLSTLSRNAMGKVVRSDVERLFA